MALQAIQHFSAENSSCSFRYGSNGAAATMTLGRRGHYASLRAAKTADTDLPLLGPNQGQYATLSKGCKTLESSDFYWCPTAIFFLTLQTNKQTNIQIVIFTSEPKSQLVRLLPRRSEPPIFSSWRQNRANFWHFVRVQTLNGCCDDGIERMRNKNRKFKNGQNCCILFMLQQMLWLFSFKELT